MRVHSLELIGDAMLPKPEPACLVMADISGYTGYLAGVELDHAQDILADLIDTIVGALRPPFQLSKLEGDAAFVYLVAPEFDGSHLQDTIESAYFTFRRRQRDIKQASHHETVEIIGDVRCWLRDLEAGWQADAARKRVEVTAAEAIASFVIDVEAARQTTWEFLTAPGGPPAQPPSKRMSRTGGAAPGRSTIACTARTSSSKRFSTGSRPITSPGGFSCSTPA